MKDNLITVVSGFDGVGKDEYIDKLLTQTLDYAEFKKEEFRKRDVIHLYASESELARTIQKRIYYNNNRIEEMWVQADGINVKKRGETKALSELTNYEQYTILFAYFMLEHIRHKGRTIVIRYFADGGDDFKILDMLDFLREIVIHNEIKLILSTNQSKYASLADRKFSFLNEQYHHEKLSKYM